MFLYSPLNSDTWYFLDWDNDGSFMRPEYALRGFTDQESWEIGVSNYWGNVLFSALPEVGSIPGRAGCGDSGSGEAFPLPKNGCRRWWMDIRQW